MKFIHTADLHLDSPLRGLSAYQDAPAERLRTATRDAFVRLVDVALEEAIDFLVIAGDIYDGDWDDFNTGLFFVRQMGRLRQAGIPVYLLYGNHDAESRMTRSLMLPDNVHVFSSRKAQSFRLPELKVVLHGRSFARPDTTDNLVPAYPDPVPGWLNIGVLHTALEGNAAHASYAPCSLAELRAKGYQYWALGHVHEYWVDDTDGVWVAFPGNLQGRHIRETGMRGALLVSADDDRIVGVSRLELDVLRWQRLEVVLSAQDDVPMAIRAAGHALADLLDDTPADIPLAVRVVFKGETAAHRALTTLDEQLRQEVIAQAVALAPDRLWIEKVRIETQAPSDRMSSTQDMPNDALDELATLARDARQDDAFVNSLISDWQQLLEKLPLDVRHASDELRSLREEPSAQLDERLKEALSLMMSRVSAADRQPS